MNYNDRDAVLWQRKPVGYPIKITLYSLLIFIIFTFLSLYAYLCIPLLFNIFKYFTLIDAKDIAKLDHNRLTNFIYIFILSITIVGATFTYLQARAAKKSHAINSLTVFFKYLHSPDITLIKNILKENKSILEPLKIAVTNGLSLSRKKELMKEVNRQFTEKAKEYGYDSININIGALLTIYNDFGLIVVNLKYMTLDEFPSLFPVNVVQYWELLKYYIIIKRDIYRDKSTNLGINIKYDFYAEHFQDLKNHCIEHLNSKYEERVKNKSLSQRIKGQLSIFHF